jgi:signal transduction histidine kinase/DNA-binding response OmpR family regulator
MKKSKLLFLLLLCGTFSATAQRTALQKLEYQWKTSPNPNRLAALSKACQDQAWWFFKRPQFNNDSTLFYFDKALALLENAQPAPNELLAALYDDLSQYRLFRSEYGLAAKLGAKALSFFKKTDKDRQEKMLHYNILRDYALAELDMGNGKYALDLFTKSAILFQNETDPATLAMLWKDKGIFYSRFSNGIGEEIKQVLNSLQKSAAFYENSSRENSAVLADIYEELAWSYNMRESYEPSKAMADSCDLYYTKLHDILPLVQNPILDARYYGQWGNKLFRRGRFDEALHYAQMSQRIMDTFQLQYHQNNMFVLNVLGTIALEKQQWEQAEAYFTKSRDVGRQQHSSNEYTYLLHMRTLYERKGDYKNALLMSDLSWEEEINLNEKLSQKNLQESELQLNVLRQEQELSKKNAERRILIAAILIALFLMGLLSLIFLKERRSKAKLAQQNQIIENQTQALRQLDTVKSRFFANVSHELRTPLTLMLAPLSTALNSKTLDDKNTTLVSLAQQNATQLLGLVNEILDLTKLESGKMAVHEEPTPVYSFLRRLVATFESYAAQKNIKLIIGFDPDMPPGLMLDKAKIERIVNNLLSNALKFTPKDGSITIKASHTTAHWQLSVSDTGRGIHPDDLPEVFNRFYQTNRSDMPVEGGTGIGLALAKELAQAMNGMLSAESTYGEGATFTLALPKQEVLGLSQEQSAEKEANALVFNESIFLEQAAVPVASNPQNGERATIMVVEDNPSLRAYLKLILSDTYTVLTAEDGQAALAILADDEQPMPNLIISDIMMPVMDGFQLLEQLKADKNRQFIPVMMLTARAEMQDRLKALRIGVDDYLTKPFDEAELFARMRNLLNNAALRQQFQSEMAREMGPKTPQEQEQNQLSTDNLAWLAEVEATVHRNIGNSYLSIDFIADEIHLSRAQFYRRLQALTGLTPNQYIQEILFNHARQLLEQRRVGSVKAAAAAIGIHTVQYFSEQFKARFGKLPSAYL